ncbi:MAG: SoxR reducing system RseC family protein [Candidatus Geothermincolia bacterium]
MQCTGTVLEAEGEIAKVYIESKACDHCQACGFGAVRDKKAMEVNALNKLGARKGDTVHLEVSGKKVMSASAIVFLIPFAGFVAGFIIGYFVIGLWVAKTPAALVTGLVLLAASYYLVYLLGNKTEFEFVIKDLAPAGEPLTPFESQSLK